MKSRINPGESLFQIVVADYSFSGNGRRHTEFTPKVGKYEVDFIPKRTLFRWAKDGKRAMRKVGRRFGTILSCHKVDSHYRHLNKIESLNMEPVKIEFDMSVDEFVYRDGGVTRAIEIEGREINIE